MISVLLRVVSEQMIIAGVCCVFIQVAKAVSQALNRCVNCLPGQRDVDNAIRTVGEASKKLLSDQVRTAASLDYIANVFHTSFENQHNLLVGS